MKSFFKAWALTTAVVCTVVGFTGAVAETYSGTSWKINGTFGNSLGGATSSASYNLVDTGGESIIGEGSGGSYTLTAGYVSQLQNALQLTLQPSGLVGYWPMEDTRGTSAQDLSINGNNALLNNTPTWGAGKVDGGLVFVDTSSQFAQAANIAALQTSTVTASAWFKTSTASLGRTIIAKSGAWQIALSRTTAGKLAVHNQTGDADVCVDTTTVNDGAWHHVAMTMNSGAANGTKLYVDGALKQACTATVLNQTGAVTIGSAGAAYYLNGTVDESKVFNRVLSADEIAAEHAAGVDGLVSGVALGAITPGTSNTVQADVIALTDASGYTLSISQDHDLTSGGYTIPALSSGTITTPAAWAEGTTKGLGFTMADTNATPIPIKWATGTKYAALPNVSTSFYTRTGIQSAVDYITLGLRADVGASQATGSAPYVNTVTITGTYTP